MTAFNLALVGLSTLFSAASKRAEAHSRAAQNRMNAEEAFSQAAATRSEATALRATADNTRREAAMQDMSTELYGFNVEQARRNARLLHMQSDIEEIGVELVGARQRIDESRILEEGRKTLATNRVFFGGNNLDTTTGSPLLAMARDAGKVAMDVELSRATGRIQALDVLKRAQNIEAAAIGEEGKAVTANYMQLSSSMKAQSLRLLGISQEDRAGSTDVRAASLDRRGFDFLARATDEDDAGWIGAASAFLRGGTELYRQGG